MNNTLTETAVLGGGCFWCTEAVFLRLRGVIDVQSGYCGGHVDNPSYEQVCEKNTGHIEVVKIEFNPQEIGFDDLLTVFFETHDPTTPDRQGMMWGRNMRRPFSYRTPGRRPLPVHT